MMPCYHGIGGNQQIRMFPFFISYKGSLYGRRKKAESSLDVMYFFLCSFTSAYKSVNFAFISVN